MMKTFTLIAIIVFLVGCAASAPTTEPAATPAPVVATTPSETPSSPPVTSGATRPPSMPSTTSSEPIGDTRDCVIMGDCVSYREKDGLPAELCAYVETNGCRHDFACSPSGEVVQKETPAFCGRS